MRISARFLISFLLGIISLFFITVPVFAQSYPTNTNPDVAHNTHTLSQSVMYDVLSAAACQLAGVDPITSDHRCLTPDASGQLGYNTTNNMGLLGNMAHLIGSTYNIPVNTSSYVAYLHNNFGVSKSYAATNSNGLGFQGLSPLLPIWVTFRNVVYLLFVIIFVIIGIAIMLRVQVDPRTVMTIENQLPKIIIGIILVTFSYGIAGFLVDAMWVVTYFGINTISQADVKTANFNLTQTATAKLEENPIGYFNEVEKNGFLGMALGGAHELQAIISNEFTKQNILPNGGSPQCNNTGFMGGVGNFFCNLGNSTVTQALTGHIGDLIGNVIAIAISWVIGIIAFFVIIIALFISMFRVWFALLKAYVYVLCLVILAPFFIVFGLIPGSAISFSAWIKNMIAHLLAFPVTVFMFVLIRVLYDNFTCNDVVGNGNPFNQVCGPGTSGSALFVPPLIGNPVGQSNTDNPLAAFIVLGMIFIIPEVLNLLNKIFGNQGVGIGAMIGTGFNTGIRSLRGVGSTLYRGSTDPATGRYTGFDIVRAAGSFFR